MGETADDQPHIVVDVDDDPDGSMHSKFHAFPARPMNSIPLPNHGRRYEFMLFPNEDKDAYLEDSKLQELFKYYDRDYSTMKIHRKAVYTFHARVAEKMRSNRTLLIGDAAHLMPPFGAQGLNAGGRDVNNLAWKLAMVVQGRASDDLLSTYYVERVAHVSDIVRMSVKIGKIANIPWKSVAWIRDSIFLTLNRFEGFRRYISEQRYLKKPVLTSGAVVHSANTTSASYIGRSIPLPIVEATKKDFRLLDEFIGSGFSLVAVAPDASVDPFEGIRKTELFECMLPTCLIVQPASCRFYGVEGATMVRLVDDKFIPLIGEHAGQVLLVRPDRYIAGEFSPGEYREFSGAVIDAFEIFSESELSRKAA